MPLSFSIGDSSAPSSEGAWAATSTTAGAATAASSATTATLSAATARTITAIRLFTRHGRGFRCVVIKAFSALAHDAAADETLQAAQGTGVFRGHKAQGIANRMGTTGAADAMHIVFRMHGKVKVHHVRDAVHIDASGGNIGGHQDLKSASAFNR